MKQLAIVMMLGLVACKSGGGGAAEPVGHAAAEGLTLEWKPATVGEVQTSVDQVETKMTFNAGPGQVVELQAVSTEKTRSETVAITPDGAVAKVRVQYEAHNDRQTMNGKTEVKASPIEGKTYAVSAEGGVIKATHEDGSPISAEEQAAIEEESDDLGKIPGMAELLLSRPWKQGEAVALTAEDLIRALGPEEQMKPQSGTLTLVAVDGGVASYQLAVEATMADGQDKLDATLEMTFELDIARVRPIAMRMGGTFRGTVQGMESTGSVTGTKTYEYQ
jgi:hypothetical protein